MQSFHMQTMLCFLFSIVHRELGNTAKFAVIVASPTMPYLQILTQHSNLQENKNINNKRICNVCQTNQAFTYLFNFFISPP